VVVVHAHASLSCIELPCAICFTDTLLTERAQAGIPPEIGAGSADGDIPYAMFRAWCTLIQVAQTHRPFLIQRMSSGH